ncbi:MAG: hypothetical protein JWO53_1155 [Chlamydiia bacterium]|nr:hypothetical protein [Chlamydiia bacterium]
MSSIRPESSPEPSKQQPVSAKPATSSDIDRLTTKTAALQLNKGSTQAKNPLSKIQAERLESLKVVTAFSTKIQQQYGTLVLGDADKEHLEKTVKDLQVSIQELNNVILKDGLSREITEQVGSTITCLASTVEKCKIAADTYGIASVESTISQLKSAVAFKKLFHEKIVAQIQAKKAQPLSASVAPPSSISAKKQVANISDVQRQALEKNFTNKMTLLDTHLKEIFTKPKAFSDFQKDLDVSTTALQLLKDVSGGKPHAEIEKIEKELQALKALSKDSYYAITDCQKKIDQYLKYASDVHDIGDYSKALVELHKLQQICKLQPENGALTATAKELETKAKEIGLAQKFLELTPEEEKLAKIYLGGALDPKNQADMEKVFANPRSLSQAAALLMKEVARCMFAENGEKQEAPKKSVEAIIQRRGLDILLREVSGLKEVIGVYIRSYTKKDAIEGFTEIFKIVESMKSKDYKEAAKQYAEIRKIGDIIKNCFKPQTTPKPKDLPTGEGALKQQAETVFIIDFNPYINSYLKESENVLEKNIEVCVKETPEFIHAIQKLKEIGRVIQENLEKPQKLEKLVSEFLDRYDKAIELFPKEVRKILVSDEKLGISEEMKIVEAAKEKIKKLTKEKHEVTEKVKQLHEQVNRLKELDKDAFLEELQKPETKQLSTNLKDSLPPIKAINGLIYAEITQPGFNEFWKLQTESKFDQIKKIYERNPGEPLRLLADAVIIRLIEIAGPHYVKNTVTEQLENYLSLLSNSADLKKMGIPENLIQECQVKVKQFKWINDELSCRYQQETDAALAMGAREVLGEVGGFLHTQEKTAVIQSVRNELNKIPFNTTEKELINTHLSQCEQSINAFNKKILSRIPESDNKKALEKLAKSTETNPDKIREAFVKAVKIETLQLSIIQELCKSTECLEITRSFQVLGEQLKKSWETLTNQNKERFKSDYATKIFQILLNTVSKGYGMPSYAFLRNTKYLEARKTFIAMRAQAAQVGATFEAGLKIKDTNYT